MIVEVVDEQCMLLWYVNFVYGDFVNDCSFFDEEKQLIFDWVDNGVLFGDLV